MEPINLDINDVLGPRRQTNNKRNKIYSQVLKLCHKRIRYNAQKRPDNCWCMYSIPNFIVGLPKFNINAATQYCLAKLRLNGFDTRLIPPKTIIISWKKYDTKIKKDIKKKYTNSYYNLLMHLRLYYQNYLHQDA